jgi:redox-sensitive bicupin YhaK (pirin superfamily)
MKQYRTLQRVINARPSSDGDGVKIRRIAGRDVMAQIDPFLMLDEIHSEQGADYIGGFPPHPHRGFETITYMLDGAMRHKDHLGNEGVIASGDVQWMTAGRGVIHSEMPEQTDGLLHGFQLWLNLPASEKMQPAAYQEYAAAQIPLVELEQGGSVKVIAGEINHRGTRVKGPVAETSTRPTYLDINLSAGESWELAVNSEQTVLLLVFSGASTELSAGQLGIYQQGDTLSLTATGEGVRALLLAGTPLREPISQHGPFVMNTPAEIEQAINDYNRGRLIA